MKLLYSTAYHPQIDRSSEHTNQTVEIALQFFVYVMEDPSQWSEVLPRIQLLLNNMSSTITGKTPNKITYKFSSRRLLDLCSIIPQPNTYVARTKATNEISFALTN